MDCYQYITSNGKHFWGKPVMDEDALDRGHGNDGAPAQKDLELFFKKILENKIKEQSKIKCTVKNYAWKNSQGNS